MALAHPLVNEPIDLAAENGRSGPLLPRAKLRQGGNKMTIRFILGLVIGAMLGASIALAISPQPGAAMREQLLTKVMQRARATDEDN